MEHFGTFFEGEMYSEEAEFMAQLLGNCSIPSHESNKNIVGVLDSNETYTFPFSSHDQSYISSGSNSIFDDLMTMNYSMMGDTKDDTSLYHDHMMPKLDVTNAKRSRVLDQVQRIKPNKRVKVDDETNEDDNINNNNNNMKASHRRKTNSCCSENDSNVSHELNGVTSTSTSKGNESKKSRAYRGSATDPQSLYARKRREKINERLRILQKLVPNGTKVDISTMLEEAVEYVKFLQVQIKLLSSDDMWMYAPIAYNGMGLDLSKSLS